MNDFLESIMHRDPAAKSKISIILTYPGVKACLLYTSPSPRDRG